MRELLVKHITQYQVEHGDMALNVTKCFPNSLSKYEFTWFATFPPN